MDRTESLNRHDSDRHAVTTRPRRDRLRDVVSSVPETPARLRQSAEDLRGSWSRFLGLHLLLTLAYGFLCHATRWMTDVQSAFPLVSPAFAFALCWLATVLSTAPRGKTIRVLIVIATIALVPPLMSVLVPGRSIDSLRGVIYVLQFATAWLVWTRGSSSRAEIDSAGVWRLLVGSVIGRAASIPVTPSAMEALASGSVLDLAVSIARGACTAFVFLALWAAFHRHAPRWLPMARPRTVVLVFGTTIAAYLWLFPSLPYLFVLMPLSVWAGSVLSRRGIAWHTILVLVLTGIAALSDVGVFANSSSGVSALLTQLWVTFVVLIAFALVAAREDRARLTSLLEQRRNAAEKHSVVLDTLVASADDGVLIVAGEGHLIQANSSAHRLTELLDHGVEGLLPSRLPDGASNPLAVALLDRLPGTHDLHVADESGHDTVIQMRCFPLDHPDLPMAVAYLRDVTPERDAAEALRQFARTAAHDLRAPLTAMSLAAELAEQVVHDAHTNPERTEELQSLLSSIVRRGEAGAALLDDLVGFALTDEARPQLERLDVGQLSRAAGTAVRDRDGQALHLVVMGRTPHVMGDRRLLSRALENLLGNAVKYAVPGTEASVTMSTEHTADGWVTIRLDDRGQGLAAGVEERIFAPFYRAPDLAGQVAGSGLGLAIVRKAIASQGATIRAVRLARGTRFEIRLPAAPSSEQRPAASAATLPEPSPVEETQSGQARRDASIPAC